MTKPITQMLHEIPDLAVEVQRTAAVGAPNPGLRSDPSIHTVPSSRPPLDLDALDLLRTDPQDGLTIGKGAATSHLVDRLGVCVRMVAEERELAGLTVPEGRYGTFAETCSYLATTAGWWLAELGLADDVGWEVEQIHRALERAARVPHQQIYHCDKCGAVAHPQPGGQWMRCEAGHEVLGEGAIRDRLRKSRPMAAAAMEREWGDALGLRADTIHAWARRGWLQEVGRVKIDRKWRPTFEPWDVMQVLQRHTGADLAESG